MAQELSRQMEDLSTPDGLLRKTNKATLATTLQTNVTVADQLPENSASVVDGMNLVQRVKGGQATFGDIVTTILSMALSEGSQSNRIDIVFDTYRGTLSRTVRDQHKVLTGHQLQGITGTQIVNKWRSFLTRVNNKTSLITFIVSEWRKVEYREKLQEILYVTVNDKCYRITSHGSQLSSASRKKQMGAYLYMLPMLLERAIML